MMVTPGPPPIRAPPRAQRHPQFFLASFSKVITLVSREKRANFASQFGVECLVWSRRSARQRRRSSPWRNIELSQILHADASVM